MEHVILGLLMLRQRSIYEIKKILEETISLFYSASFGSINSAIEKLVAKQAVTVQEQVEGGRFKKIYSITPIGQTLFEQWLASAIPQEKVKDPALTRLFFMGFLAPSEQIRLLREHLGSVQMLHAQLNSLLREREQINVAAEQQALADFQWLTLEYGVAYYGFNINWYQQLLSKLEESGHE